MKNVRQVSCVIVLTLSESCLDNQSGSELGNVKTNDSWRCLRSKHSCCTPFVWIISRERVNVDAATRSSQYKCECSGGCSENAGIAEGLTKSVTALVDCFVLR